MLGRFLAARRGNVFVEYAIVAPLLLAIVMGGVAITHATGERVLVERALTTTALYLAHADGPNARVAEADLQRIYTIVLSGADPAVISGGSPDAQSRRIFERANETALSLEGDCTAAAATPSDFYLITVRHNLSVFDGLFEAVRRLTSTTASSGGFGAIARSMAVPCIPDVADPPAEVEPPTP